MREPLLIFLLPLLVHSNGDEDLNKFLAVPKDLEKDIDYETAVKQMDEGTPIDPFPPKAKESRVSAAREMHEEEDYGDLLSKPTNDQPSADTVHLLEEIDASPATVAKKAGANGALKLVTFAPFKPTFRIPITTTTVSPFIDSRNPEGYGPSQYRPGQQSQYTPAPRNFNYFAHYPFYRLPKVWRLRPDVIYTYPNDLQNTNYQYPHRLPYTDIYGFLRHPNPYGCGLGVSAYQTGEGGCGGSSSGSSSSFPRGERPIGTLNENGKGEWTENDDLNLANKEDPLEDISLETLEKIDRAGKLQDKKKNKKTKTTAHPTLVEDNDLIDGHLFMPIEKDEEKFTRVGEESLVGIGSKDTAPQDEVAEASEIGKEVEKEKGKISEKEEKISPEALEELKAFENEFSNLPPRLAETPKGPK